jgi:hypothetical protein
MENLPRNSQRFITALLLCFLACLPLPAQTSGTGALTVTVTDPSGAVIAGSTVTLTNGATVTRKQTTDANGSYTFGLLPPGDYKVSISAPGFKTAEVPSVKVNVSETGVLSQPLQVGEQTQQVQVSANAEVIQTETSTLGGVVGTQTITDLPLVTRNYQQILSLSPGVEASVSDGTALGRGSLPTYANGNMDTSNSYQMDGVSVNNYANSSVEEANSFYGSIPVPNPDALQEFKVQTSNYDSSYGRNSGAAVNVITKSGTNDWHGTLFEFLRNDDLNANTFFANRQGLPRGKLKQNQYGGTFGGPVLKNKLFFFLSYEGTRQVNAVASLSTSSVNFPQQLTDNRTAAALGAAFCPPNNPAGSPGAAYANAFNPNASTPLPVTDQVACNGSNISPVALNILNAKLPNGQFAIPSPQSILNAGTTRAVGFSSYSVPAAFKEDQALFNIDYLISPKHTLAMRYFYADGVSTAPFNTAAQPYSDGQRRLTGNQLFSGKLTSLLTTNMVNEAHFSSYYIRAFQASLVPFTAASLGITSATSFNSEVPPITITGLLSLFGNSVDAASNPQRAYEWSDQVSWSRGRHTIRFGYDQTYIDWRFCSCGKSRGSLTFQTWADFLLGMSAAQNGTAVAPFANLSNVFSASASGQSFNDPNLGRENQGFGFVQDDYKVTSTLTLNLGLRWEYDGSPFDTNPLHGGTNVDWGLLNTVPIPPASGTLVGYSVANNFSGTVPAGVFKRNLNLLTYGHAPFDNFAPRFGLAWQPLGTNSRLVVRGGYGWFYQLNDGQHYLDTLDGNPPLAAAIALTGTSAALATFAVPFNPPATPAFASFLRTPTSSLRYTAVDPRLITPMTQAWNLSVQYAIKGSLVAEVAYVGNRAEHIDTGTQFNFPMLATPTAPLNCGLPTGCVTINTSQNATQRVPVIGDSIGGYNMTSNTGDSRYHAVQGTLRKSFSHGFQFQISYTFGHCMTDVSGLSFTAAQGGNVNWFGALQNRALADAACGYNRPQRLVLNYTYQLPVFHSGRGFAGHALSGWGVSGVTTAQQGLPMTFTDPNGAGVYGLLASPPMLCPGVTFNDIFTSGSVKSRLSNFFNLNAFSDTAATKGSSTCALPIVGAFPSPGPGLPASPGATGYGNVSQNILRGPSQLNFDISIGKRTRVGGIREDATLEFRTELFNAFNHAQFSNPNTVVNSGAFGTIGTTSTGPRIMQFGLKYLF